MANILVVDDSTVMRRGLSLILTKAGHTVVGQATNGEQAFLLYSRIKPDLVTMDITMPTMDGIDAMKSILKNFPDAKIVVISSLDQKKTILEAVELGAKHYIVKPFKDAKVLTIINEVLQEKKIG
ncbi:MAG: response regulator [Methanomassiliicoccales archaeon]